MKKKLNKTFLCLDVPNPGPEIVGLIMEKKLRASLGGGGGTQDFSKTHKADTMNIALSCMAVAFTGLTNSSKEYAVHTVIAREAGLQKKKGQPLLLKATLYTTQIIFFPICYKCKLLGFS